MAKADDIARLKVLAEQLGREADISGSAAEIRQRLAEMEEEIASDNEAATDAGDGAPVTLTEEKAETEKINSPMVRVTMLDTVHASGVLPDTGRHVELLICGETVMVTSARRDALINAGVAGDA